MSVPSGSRPTTRHSSLSHARIPPASAASHTAKCSTGSEIEANADVSSDEDGGVFFGLHTSVEAQTVAKLCFDSSTPPQSSKRAPKRTSHIGRDSHSVRVTKRDSREFLRRKTLLLPSKANDEAVLKAQSAENANGGYNEPRQRHFQEDSDPPSPVSRPLEMSTPFQTDLASDLTLIFTQFKMSALSPVYAEPPDSGSESEGTLSDSDKENTLQRHPPRSMARSPVNVYRGGTFIRGMTSNSENEGTDNGGSQTSKTLTLVELEDIDLGGLRMSDFSDPETGLECDLDRQSDALGSDGLSETDRLEEADLAAMIIGTSMADETLKHVGEERLNATDSDSPLPVARGGPVIIPLLPHRLSIRAESGSPFRSLPYFPPRQPDPEFDAAEVDGDIRIVQVDSPTPQMQRPLVLVPSIPITSSTCKSTSTVEAVTWDPTLHKSALPLVASTAGPSQKPRKPFPTALPIAERAAIRGHLTAAVASKMRPFGPPHRSFSITSASSSSSTSSSLPVKSNNEMTGIKMPLPVTTSTKLANGPAAMQRRPHAVLLRATAITALKSSTTLENARARPAPSASTKETTSHPNPPTAAPSRPIMFHRPMQGKQVIRAAIGGNRFNRPAPLTERPTFTTAPAKIQVSPGLNSLKRPPHTIQPIARAAVATGSQAPRLVLGLPSRIPSDPLQPTFIFGITSEHDYVPPVRAFKSPGRGLFQTREPTLATPLRKLGTPGRLTTRHPVSNPLLTPIRFVRQPAEMEEAQSAEQGVTPPRGSSQDHEDVSVQLTGDPIFSCPPSTNTDHNLRSVEKASSPQNNGGKADPEDVTPNGRPTRTVNTPQTRPDPPRTRQPGPATAPCIVPNMSEKELKTTTHRNTKRNEVYHCAIDRQIVRIPGARPPSPSSKIRTTADRDEAERKSGRGQRARRRAKGSEDESVDEPLVEYVMQTKGPGDEEDWATPARPVKKAKTSHPGKNVRWDKSLVLIRDQGDDASVFGSQEARQASRTALRDGEVQLDQHGNLIHSTRPKENLKRGRIVVTAVFYDGEEPYHIPPPYVRVNGGNASSGKANRKGG